jgi:aminoglycoside phosphotransferase (APT) family kinase protein
MEYLGTGFSNWKQQMLAGVCEASTAGQIGSMLGIIHKRSADDAEARDTFATLKDFEQLRIDPYLLATAKKHPELAGLFREEADRLRASRRVLTHGDFSPKNILVSKDRLVLVDCEVAWFGDPAFDVAFGLNHLLLKSVARPHYADQLRSMARSFWTSYQKAAGSVGGTETEVARLLLMLMLARIDGKSPVEYLDESQRQHVRKFAMNRLAKAQWRVDCCMIE